MSDDTTQKPANKSAHKSSGPLLLLPVLFADAVAVAELFRTVRWANGIACPHCTGEHINIHANYKGLKRYRCKGCGRTFNDKTGTILHYTHIEMGNWMLAVWMYLCGPLNGISINYIAEAIGHTYCTTYYTIRDIMDHILNLQEKMLSGICETDELYVRAASKGVPLSHNDEARTMPSRRGLPRGPGRGTFEKNTPMVTIYHQRATETQEEWTIFEVPRDGKSLVATVQSHIEFGSRVMTDEYKAYKNLEKLGYDHLSINHSEGEYASGVDNEVHTNNCECRAGLLKWWLRKHRGVSKWHLESYVKTFQFVHNHRHHPIDGRFMVTLETLLA